MTISMLRARTCWRGLRLLRGLSACSRPPKSPITFVPAATSPAHLPIPRHALALALALRSFSAPPGGSSSSVITIKNEAEYVSALNLAQENNGFGVVYFTAKWCGPCKMVSPVVDELSIKYNKATFLKVDIDEENLREVVSDEKITSVPTFRFFRGGKSIGEVIGADASALKDKVAAFSEK